MRFPKLNTEGASLTQKTVSTGSVSLQPASCHGGSDVQRVYRLALSLISCLRRVVRVMDFKV